MGCASSTEREREGQGNARGEASSSAKQQPPVSTDTISLTVQANGSGDKSSSDAKGGSNGAAGGKQQEKVETALSTSESVQRALLQVTTLVQQFGEGRTERTTAIQALRRALDLLAQDAHAAFASVHVLPEDCEAALLVALVGAPPRYVEANRLLRLGDTSTGVETVVKQRLDYLSWNVTSSQQPPSDWRQLHQLAGLRLLTAVPIKVAGSIFGLLTLGFEDNSKEDAGKALWSAYMQLVAASLCSMVKDNGIHKYLTLVKEVQVVTDMDSLVHLLVKSMRDLLGHQSNDHVWYKLALVASNDMAATIFDDLSQVPSPLMLRVNNTQASSTHSAKLLKEAHAKGGIMHTVVSLKNTVMKVALRSKQQVMIPDVQKLINQSGYVSSDIFNTRVIKPPTSVVVFPLRNSEGNVYGVVYCMSSVQASFADVSPKMREACEVVSPHVLHVLSNQLATEYAEVQTAQVMTDGGSSHSLLHGLSSSGISSGGNLNTSRLQNSGDSYSLTQSHPSTGALVTGLTEKLNQKRIKSSMDSTESHDLEALQITHMLGEGGFAKVFCGLWRGLIVGVKVVCDDGNNEKNIIKNAHEIAILRAISHPNIVQAFACMTDVPVCELLRVCMAQAHGSMFKLPVYKYLQSMADKICHLEVIDYCDIGNMGTALKNYIFQVPRSDKLLAGVAMAARNGLGSDAWMPQPSGNVYLHRLLLTLMEISSAMAYLHSMGVVHCDIKPGNVLLRSSHLDPRGFTTKLSDFGLSRVEDDEQSSFPFNSCGTAAYVAPEALICNRKVNSSVDVYAFGILMWEMYTGLRPYGSMKQQKIVEEVVMRGLRPKFPPGTPAMLVELAQACWSGAAASRPSFDEVLDSLNAMLQGISETTTVMLTHGQITEELPPQPQEPPTSRPRSGGATGGHQQRPQQQAPLQPLHHPQQQPLQPLPPLQPQLQHQHQPQLPLQQPPQQLPMQHQLQLPLQHQHQQLQQQQQQLQHKALPARQ